MSQENVETVKRFEKLMLAKEAGEDTSDDYSKVLELLTPDVVVRVCPSLPHGGEWIGHDGFVDMSNAIVGARTVTDVPDFTYLDAGGDLVVVIIAFTHEVHDNSEVAPIRMVEIFTLRDGRIASLDPYYEDTVPFAIASGRVKAA